MKADKNIKPHGHCTAKSKQTGKQCKLKSIDGKDKCRFHGGLTPVKHGLYSKYMAQPVKKKYLEFLENSDLKDLSHEIARLRAILAEMDENNLSSSPDNIPLFLSACEAISRLTERHFKILEGSKFVITIENVQVMIQQVVVIISRHVTDVETRQKIALDLANVKVLGGENGN